MKILIGPISLSGRISINAQNPSNPGIGGSEYHSIVLATILSEDFEVTLWLESGSLDISGPKVSTELHPGDDFDLQISFSSSANVETPRPYPLVAISHHPFDAHILQLPARTLVIANVGNYQLKTNTRLACRVGIPQIWLPVFLRKPRTCKFERPNGNEFVVGHVSSLHPSKGFHDVLSAWMEYLAMGGRGTLQVLGGQSLYGLSESHPILPVSNQYGIKLMAMMGGEVHESVEFLGRIPGDVEHVISSWDLAVLNPRGFGESESVSMKDCWRESVPVIAGNRFGQRDYMRFFPELASSKPREIARIIKSLSEDPSKLESLQSRSQTEYQRLYERGVESGILWRELAMNIVSGSDVGDFGMPTPKGNLSLSLQIGFEALQLQLMQFASRALTQLRVRKP